LPEERRRRLAAWCIAVIAFGAALSLWMGRGVVLAQPAVPGQLAVYAPQAYYNVPILSLHGQPYVGLVELLEPLGTVDARVDGKKLKMKFSAPNLRELELQFQDGKDKGKVRGQTFKLPGNFVIQNARGYIPLSAVNDVLARALAVSIRLNPAAGRLFIGDVGLRFSLDMRSGPPAKLFISFDAAVNPTIATEPGHIRFTFRRDAVLPAVDHVSFNDPLITGATFTEHDGAGELDIAGTVPLMANFADGRKTIIVTGVPAPPPVVVAPPPQPQLTAPTQAPPNLPKPPSGPRYFVMIDPAHGGSDIGAAITNDLAEKDLVLTLARRVQKELESRGIPAMLLRTSDTAISLDQRAVTTNAARPAIYVVIHAANTGSGVHVYTSMTESSSTTSRDFLPWESAQSAFAEQSEAVAASVMGELVSRKLPNSLMAAPLRPMNNIAAAAIAVEIASPDESVPDIAKASYLDQVAQAIATGIATYRNPKQGTHP